MPDEVRVRFAPAPTGSLHVGGARTALFNWLYARRHRGAFVLRIEDTDPERSRPEWIDGIQRTLRWLGLDWDDGPVLQSQRTAEYRVAVEQLLEQGDAYECFETPDELEEISRAAVAAGRPPGYDGRARSLTTAERERLRAEGRPRTIRFRTPDDGTSAFVDLVRGEVAVPWSTVTDFVIVRSDDTPTFFLANAVDDAQLGITHVIRGEDLLDSTHRVLALRAALGYPDRPRYAHLPLLVGADRAKLSKRHGAVALEDFRAAGYLPEALVNYLALLGWSSEDGREILSRDELVERFDLGRVTHSAAYFDHDKLDHLNGEYIRALPVEELAARIEPLARERFGARFDRALLRAAAELGQERSTTLRALLEQSEFLFVDDDELQIAEESWQRVLATDRAADVLDAARSHLAQCEWTVEAIDLRPVLDRLGCKPRKVLPAVYAAIEGRHHGLPLFDSIALLGRERALRRLDAARRRLAG